MKNNFQRFLGVNIDHVATVRNARGGINPQPVQAAIVAEQAGADQITIHLREDRRHIKDTDLALIKNVITTKLNLEMALNPEIVEIAIKTKPDTVTLVPEKREELTTEGGLLLRESMKSDIERLKKAGIEVSLFIEPDSEAISLAAKLGADAVEMHTGVYANNFGTEIGEAEFLKIKAACQQIADLNMRVVAGHGLDYHNIYPLLELPISEFNIGHSIIAESVFYGLAEAVRKMKRIVVKGVF